jgi:hypothetical protein
MKRRYSTTHFGESLIAPRSVTGSQQAHQLAGLMCCGRQPQTPGGSHGQQVRAVPLGQAAAVDAASLLVRPVSAGDSSDSDASAVFA